MNILVTGGSGFIGNHLCRKLLEQGNRVICLDSNITGRMENIEDMRSNPKFEFIRHDINTPIYIEADQIYHLACPASPKAYQKNGIKTIKTCVLGTMNALGIAKRTNARILLTSTSEVNVNPIGPRACYDEGKRVAETLMVEYKRNHNVDIRIARIFNTYGPKMAPDDGRVISSFITACLLNNNISVFGDGKQTRSFCYVSDTVDGLIKLMNSQEYKGPINIGNPHEITIIDMAKKIINTISTNEIKIIHLPLPEDDPLQRCPDISKAKKILGWYPQINMEDGIEKTISYFKSVIK